MAASPTAEAPAKEAPPNMALAVSGLSYVIVERPFLRLKRRPLIEH